MIYLLNLKIVDLSLQPLAFAYYWLLVAYKIDSFGFCYLEFLLRISLVTYETLWPIASSLEPIRRPSCSLNCLSKS